jgi:hypothetical protein
VPGPPLRICNPLLAHPNLLPHPRAPFPPGGRPRCVVCYFGHHYQAFCLSEELGQWLLFDDDRISLVGDWGRVQAAMKAARLQPSLLLYEQVAPAAAPAE